MATTEAARPTPAYRLGERVINLRKEERFICWVHESGKRFGLGSDPNQRVELEFVSIGEIVRAPLPITSTREAPPGAFPHQVFGIRWLDQQRSCLLADEPGLGKTLQACSAADPRVVVVCPAAMRVEWQRELAKWRPELTCYVVTGTKPVDAHLLHQYDAIVINYDVLSDHLETLEKLPLSTLIVDEAHNVKTLKSTGKSRKLSGSKRAMAVARLSEHAQDKRFYLTGTPVENRPIEIWPMLYMINPSFWGNYSAFGMKFCAGRLTEVGRRGKRVKTWDFSGSSNVQRLHQLLSRSMLRRKKEVLDLPPKSRQTIYVALDEATAKEYSEAMRDFVQWVGDNGGPVAVLKHLAAPAVTKLTALRKLAARGKLEAALDWIVAHAEGTGRPLVVMAHHREVTDGIADRLAKTDFNASDGRRAFRVGRIIGGMSEAQRTSDKDQFQAGNLDVIVCSIQAAGVGLTLTKASETLFVERAWKPALLVQAEDRIYRIGQKNSVTITYMDAAGTVDEWLKDLLVDKQSTVSGVVDGVDLDEQAAEEFVLGKVLGLRDGNEDYATGQRKLNV